MQKLDALKASLARLPGLVPDGRAEGLPSAVPHSAAPQFATVLKPIDLTKVRGSRASGQGIHGKRRLPEDLSEKATCQPGVCQGSEA